MEDFTAAKKTFSRLGFALVAILLSSFVAQNLMVLVPVLIWGADNWFITSSTGMWISTFAPIYLVAMPVGLLILKKIPVAAPEAKQMRFGGFLRLLPMAFFMMYAGNLVGNYLATTLSGGNASNALMGYALDNNPLKILVMVILAPLLEEFIFRKKLIDCTRQYGEKTAVMLSAVTFALFHTNLYQFFYAFALGWLFAYVYVRTGYLRYPVILHGIINFMGSVLAPALLNALDLEALSSLDPNAAPEAVAQQLAPMIPGLIAYVLYAGFLFFMSIMGLIMVLKRYKKWQWKEAEAQLPKERAAKVAYGNPGMILFIVLSLGMTVLTLLMV